MNDCSSHVTRPFLPFIVIMMAAATAAQPPSLGAENVHVAVLGLENLNRDPRYDYLEGMIIGVLMFDLTRIDDIDLVERARMDRIINEQNLRLTGLLNDEDTAKQIGQLAGADALIEGDYAFLGRDIIINIRILMTDDGTTIPLSVRGFTENSIHSLAEQIVRALTGKPVILAGLEGERSLLSLSDEEPGSIEFYCNFIQGEIYIDEEFYGYTPGGTTPILLEDLSPGEHILRVEGGNDFGEIEWPELIFKDWQRTVSVKTGRKSVVRASIYHFNNQLYDARRLFSERWRLEPGVTELIEINEDGTYIDTSGRSIPVSIRLNASIENKRPVIIIEIEADGETYLWDIDRISDEIDFTELAGPLEIEFERDWYSNRYWSIELAVRRRDIRQGMHRE